MAKYSVNIGGASYEADSIADIQALIQAVPAPAPQPQQPAQVQPVVAQAVPTNNTLGISLGDLVTYKMLMSIF